MLNQHHLIYNGKLLPSKKPILSPDNRSFKYGDGFFETMKMIDGNIIFQDLHFERLFSSLPIMQFDTPDDFTKERLLQEIKLLTAKNNHQRLARIRLTIFRGDGNLSDVDNKPNYIIQSWALAHFPSYNEEGVCINIYQQARKTNDAFSNIKSNNYLPYAMAALWCKKNKSDDAIVMNNYDRIAEATTSNLFLVKEKKMKTPALTEGCVAGVTRRYLLTCFAKENIDFEEAQLTIDDVMNADEIFLTNTGWYIQWIRQFEKKIYINETSKSLYEQFIKPILAS